MERLTIFTYITVVILSCNCYKFFIRPDISFPEFERKKVILLEANDLKHIDMNKRFCYFLLSNGSSYYCTFGRDPEYPFFFNPYRIQVIVTKVNDINDTLSIMQENTETSVVNLRAPDFFTLNYNVYKKFNYIIDENVIKEQEVCKVNVKYEHDSCKIAKEKIHNTVIVNVKSKEDNELMDLIEKFISVKSKFIVLICGYKEENLTINLSQYVVIYLLATECPRVIKEKNKDLIAVVINQRQHKITHITDVPIVFTEINRKYEENDRITPNGIYPNVMKRNIVSTAIVNFLLEMGWQRVAIVSDDSLNSFLLQKKLIEEMDTHNMAYYESRPVTKKEEFIPVLKTLREKFARIIIANVQERNVSYIMSAFQTLEMSSPNYILIFTASYSKLSYLMTTSTDIFYVSFDHTDINIGLKALNSISLNPYNNDVTTYYSQIFDYAKREYSSFKASILKVREEQPSQTIVEVDFRNGKVKNVKRISFPYEPLPTDAPHCIISSYYFDKCHNDLLLLLVSVIAIFILFIAIIFLYFEDLKTNNQYLTMESNFT